MKSKELPKLTPSEVYFLFDYRDWWVSVQVKNGKKYDNFDDIPCDVLFKYRVTRVEIDHMCRGEVIIHCDKND